MKFKKAYLLILAALLLTTGCGKQAAAPEAPAATEAVIETPVPEAPAATVEPTALPNVDPTYQICTADGLLTIQLPSRSWYQIVSDENTEMFSDGDCAILVNLYRVSDTLPAAVTSDANHALIYTATVSVGDYVLRAVGYAHGQADFSAIGKAINSIVVDRSKIVPSMLKHEVEVSEYSIREVSYSAWVTADFLNVRSASGTDATVLTTLKRDTKLTVTGIILKNGSEIGWSRIKLANGSEGYVSSQFLTTNDPEAVSKVGQPITVYTASGTKVQLQKYSDGTWRTTDNVKYRLNSYGNYVNDKGEVLYAQNPTAPYRTGETCTVFTQSGTTVTLYKYSDGNWRNSNNVKYYVDAAGNFVSDNGNVLYPYRPTQTTRTGYTQTLYRANGSVVVAYGYTDNTWRDDSGYYYTEYTATQWKCVTTGEILDMNPPAPAEPTRTGVTQTWYDASGNTVILYAYTDGSWRDESGDRYWSVREGVMGNASGKEIYAVDPSKSSEPSATGVTELWYDAAGNPVVLYAYTDGSWRDEYGDRYWSVREGVMGNANGREIYNSIPAPQRTGFTETWYDCNRKTVVLYAYTDGAWRDEKGQQYWNAGGGVMATEQGRELFDTPPEFERNGNSQTWYETNGTPVVLYAYTDNGWRDEDSIQYWPVSENVMRSNYGKELHAS